MADVLIVRDKGDERLCIITLNRPESRNAMSVAMVDALLELLECSPESAHRPPIGAILLSGTGKGFCAGSDLRAIAAMTAEERSAFEAACGRLARVMVHYPRPILCAVHGFAIGGGLTLAAACDIVITAPDARWSLPEVPIGLFPAWGLEAVSMRVGRVRARRLAWGIDTLEGTAAASWGLADQVDGDPAQRALALARDLAALPPAQTAAVKNYFAEARTGEAADAHANQLFMAACASAEAAASLARFAR